MSPEYRDSPLLHLTAFDAADLHVISAQMQDAVIRYGDMKYVPRARKFALVANRFAWDAVPEKTRRRTGLNFSNILSVRRRGPAQVADDTILSLLSITFMPNKGGDGLSGEIALTFAGRHVVALMAECIDAQLDDLGPAWSATRVPEHKT